MIVGQIKNIGKVEIPQTKVVVLGRDASGKATDVGISYAEKSIPGQIVPFKVPAYDIESTGTFEVFLRPELVEGTY